MNRTFSIVGLGEVLWDCLPDGKRLGGAPANFAYVCSRLGAHGIIAARVGNDADGVEILERLRQTGVEVEYMQSDDEHATGTVNISLQNGQPSYQITENAAWDFLEMTPPWRQLAQKCDAVCFGSLAQRGPVSRETIGEFVRSTRAGCLRIFDVNLRQNYFSADVLRESLSLADVVKLNHDELPVIAEMFESAAAGEIERARELRRMFELKLVCLTRGAGGSLLVTENEISEHPGLSVRVADTIGAGDAFTAALVCGLLNNGNLDEINQRANEIGAFVASKTGAMPEFPNELKL